MPEGPAPPLEPSGETEPPTPTRSLEVGKTYRIRSGEIVAGPQTRVGPGTTVYVVSRDDRFATIDVPSMGLRTTLPLAASVSLVEVKGGRRRRRTRKTRRRQTRRRK